MNVFFTRKVRLLATLAMLSIFFKHVKANPDSMRLGSPDGHIQVHLVEKSGKWLYSVSYKNRRVLESSALGLKTKTTDFYNKLSLVRTSAVEQVSDQYETLNAKRKHNNYTANKQIFYFETGDKKKINIRFQVSNDGVVFRYEIPKDASLEGLDITEELTSFKFPVASKGWLQPVAVAKSGWEQTNPSYEEHYQQGIAVGTPEPTNTGWVYPALFQSDDTWVLITEAGLDGNYCATRLRPDSPNGEYRVGFPDPREVMPPGDLLPRIQGDFRSPWRVLTIGNLATIAESTLGLDVADKEIFASTADVIRLGKSSWSWINTKDDFIVYYEQKKYIDFAADMKWQYCLIDVNWDRKIGYDKIKELANYAASKQVGLLLWYNSAGDWNTVGYTPKNKLLTKESRREEFQRIRDMGIKGVKIDFFGGDGRSVIQYYIDILKDAAEYDLLVNFHGATLPRGWSRTYPHLMTVEAVRGFEMVTFGQDDSDKQATLSTILPFTRNAFDPMDFTPMNLHKINSSVQRRTTAGFELATSILFLSGIQHYAESPEGMANVPEFVKDFLRTLPDHWDDMKYLSGFPGKDVVIARKAGSTWYVAGINGERVEKKIKLDLSALGVQGDADLITDGEDPGSFVSQKISTAMMKEIALKPDGGFVLVVK